METKKQSRTSFTSIVIPTPAKVSFFMEKNGQNLLKN